jgi:uncharacterized protein YndB with AHSA1/START domain
MTDVELRSSVTIEAPAEDVWEALTTPSLIKQWFFGVETQTDWRIGGSLVHRGEFRGEPYEDKGTILEFEPPRVLAHSHWSPTSGQPDLPENYQAVRWTLDDRGGETEITVTETNLPTEDARAVSERAWEGALTGLKRLIESGGAVRSGSD